MLITVSVNVRILLSLTYYFFLKCGVAEAAYSVFNHIVYD